MENVLFEIKETNSEVREMEKTFEECLNVLYKLGVVQGEHNINWADEYNLLEHSRNYYDKIKAIADEYDVEFDYQLEDYREDSDDDEYFLWDRMGFHLNEITQEHILNMIRLKG